MPAALRLALVALLVATRITTAQETATEQVAAADVIRRMSELERSLALPQLVARLTGARDARRDAVIARAKDLMDRELLAMADDITRHPETGWKEERSVKILTDYLTAHGFDVEPGVAGLKTAFVARYRKGTPGPNLGVIVEYDALRGTSRDFHGDQHSAQGPVGLAAAVAVTEFLTSSKTPGTVTVYGTPAEELASPAAKTVMYNAGVFKGADVLIRSHSSTATQAPGAGFGSCCMNINLASSSRNGISVAALNAVAFAYMKKFGATKVQDEPGRPISFEETGTVATQIPGVGVTAHSSNGGYHTFEMEADALGEVGHHGFLVDAQTMTAVLYHLATDAPYRAAVQREFDGLKGLYSEYLAALRSAYPLPTVPEPTGN